jgi:hypothetical protein
MCRLWETSSNKLGRLLSFLLLFPVNSNSDPCAKKAEKVILDNLTGYVKAGVHRYGPTVNASDFTTGALVGFGPTWLGHIDVSRHLRRLLGQEPSH